MSGFRVTVADALRKLGDRKDGKRFVQMQTHGSLSVEFYAPRGRDPQTPHTRVVWVIFYGPEGGER